MKRLSSSRVVALCLVCALAASGRADAPAQRGECLGEDCVIEPYSGESLTLNLQDAPVRRVLQLIADFAGLNLVAGDDVEGDMTLRLADVPWDQALDLVLATNGLGKQRSENVLLVAPAAAIAERERHEAEMRAALAASAPLETRFIRIRYAEAGDLAALFGAEGEDAALSERGRVLVDERTNSLILTDSAANLDAFEEVIERLDIPVRQVQIEARIVNANQNFSKQLGIRWGVEVRNEGAAAPAGDGQGVEEGTDARAALTLDGALALAGQVAAPGVWLDAELSASVDAGEAEIVARPKVVTADKQAATIEAGVEIPYQQATKSGATSIAFKDAVLQLRVTPRITPNGRIVMDLEVKQDTVGRIYHGVPSINTTRIVTQVLVDDGATVVLGGIFQTDKHHATTRTPLLGDLPLLGRAFRRTTKRDDKQELFVFITPAIVEEPSAGSARGNPSHGRASAGEREGHAARMREPSAGEREGPAPRMREPSAGEREGLAPRMKRASAGEREGLAPRKRESSDA